MVDPEGSNGDSSVNESVVEDEEDESEGESTELGRGSKRLFGEQLVEEQGEQETVGKADVEKVS